MTEVINDELTPIRERRREYAEDLEKVYNILKEGTEKAKKTADKTIVEVKKAMKLNYFEDSEYLNELLKKEILNYENKK